MSKILILLLLCPYIAFAQLTTHSPFELHSRGLQVKPISGVVTPIDPVSVSGLVACVKGGEGIVLTGANMTKWQSTTGATHDFNAIGAGLPPITVDGKQVPNFDGTTIPLLASGTLVYGDTAFGMIFVVRPDFAMNVTVDFQGLYIGGNDYILIRSINGQFAPYIGDGNAHTFHPLCANFTQGVPEIIVINYSKGAKSIWIYQQGTVYTATDAAWSPNLQWGADYALGDAYGFPSTVCNGKTFDFAIYNHLLTVAQINGISKWMSQRWTGITLYAY